MSNYNETFKRESAFTDEQLHYSLKQWIRNSIDDCNKQIKHAEEALILSECLPENYTIHQRSWEVFTYRKKVLEQFLKTADASWLNPWIELDKNK